MDAWNIYHKDGSVLCDVDGNQVIFTSLENTDVWMGECSVSITVKNNSPIIFSIGDYVIYRNERYEINYDPGKIKASSKNTYGEGFVYNDIKFNSLSDELVRAEFLDVVLFEGTVNVDGIETPLHYTALPKFSFYVEFIDDLLDRIQANMNEQYGDGVWKIFSTNMERSVVRGCSDSDWHNAYGDESKYIAIESQSVTVDNSTCWDALSLVNSKWDITFIVRGRNVYVGINGPKAPHVFKYGKGNGLREIEQTVDSEQNVITRLRAYGSDKNMPQRYYAELGKKCFANVTKVDKSVSNFIEITTDLPYNSTLFNTPRTYKTSEDSETFTLGWAVKVTFDFQTVVTAHIEPTATQDGCCIVHTELGEPYDTGDELDSVKLQKFIESASVGKKLYFTRGIYKSAFEKEFIEFDNNMPNNMAVNRLMLPGFPDTSLSAFWNTMTDEEKKYVNPTGSNIIFSEDKYRPYLDSPEKENAGLRQYSMYFDNDDKKNGIIEIYPTIEEMVVSGERIDEISVGSSIDDNGVFDDGQEVKDFYIKLKKQIDFDLNDVKNDDFSISLKDGMCGGRTFKINACTKESDGSWSLKCTRVKDDALELWFPYKDYPIRKGDHFVLTGLELPDSYIRAASIKLLKYSISYLNSNCKTRYAFQLKVDDLFMARQHDLSVSDSSGATKSLYKTLRAGDVMSIRDEDLGIDSDIVIEQLTIKEEEGNIPSYEITLRDDKSVGAITKIQDKIDSIYSAVGTGGTLNESQVESVVAKVAGKLFVTNDWFGRIFNIVDQYGNKQGENEGIAENSSIRAKMSLWSDGGISALGNSASSGGSGGSGGGGLDEEMLWSLLGNSGTEQISKSHLTDALAGYATEEWIEDKGYLTSHQDISGKADRSELSGYLPLTGGTLTGNLNLGGNTLFAQNISLESETKNWNFKHADSKLRFLFCTNKTAIGAPGTYWSGISAITGYTGFQLATYGSLELPHLYFRHIGDENSWSDWWRVYHEGFKPTKSDVGLGNVDNTADANKSVSYAATSGVANSVAWTNVSDKPTTLGGYGITDGIYHEQVGIEQDNITWFEDYAKAHTHSIIYNTQGNEYAYLINMRNDYVYGNILKIGYADTYLRMLRRVVNKWQSNNWEKISAGYADSAGTLDGVSNGSLTANYFNCSRLDMDDTLDDIPDGVYAYYDGYNPTNAIGQNAGLLQLRGRFWDRAQLSFPGNSEGRIYYRQSYFDTETTIKWYDWKPIAFISDIAWSNVSGKPTRLSDFTDDVVSGKYLSLQGGTVNGRVRFNGIVSAGEYRDDNYGIYTCTRNHGDNCCYSFVNVGMVAYGIGYDASYKMVLGEPKNGGKAWIGKWLTISSSTTTANSFVANNSIQCNGQGSFNSIQIGNITISYDAANKGLRIAGGGLYTDSYLSSLGVDASTALSVKKWADSIGLTTENDGELATAYSIGNLYRLINSNQKSITESLNQSVGALQGRCTSLEQRVSALEKKVNK